MKHNCRLVPYLETRYGAGGIDTIKTTKLCLFCMMVIVCFFVSNNPKDCVSDKYATLHIYVLQIDGTRLEPNFTKFSTLGVLLGEFD